jgi:hypothetical protein
LVSNLSKRENPRFIAGMMVLLWELLGTSWKDSQVIDRMVMKPNLIFRPDKPPGDIEVKGRREQEA